MTRLFSRSLSALCALAALAPPAHAQYTGSTGNPIVPADQVTSSVTVGPVNYTSLFSYAGLERPGAPEREGSGIALRLTSETATLLLGYVPDDTEPEVASTAASRPRAFAALSVGPTYRPFTVRGDTRASLMVPIKLGVGYEYDTPPTLVGDDLDAFQLFHVGLGAGLGLEGSRTLESSFASEVSARIGFLLMPGVLADFSDEPAENAFAQRTSEFDLEVRASRVAGRDVGVAVGYTLRSMSWSGVPSATRSNFVDAIGASGYIQRSRVGMIRLGITL